MTGIASHLRRAGYRTHLVGKWDAGMATAHHHPRARGYDSWLGYWHHSNDYWAQTEEKCAGHAVHDLWAFNATHDGPAAHFANGPSCGQDNQSPAGEPCVFEELILRDEVVRLIEAHDAAHPLFLMYSMHLVHMPLQAPQRYIDRFQFIDDPHRRLNHAMGLLLDDSVSEVVQALRRTQLWESTLLVFHSDNGGEIMGAGICGGNNFPLTGGKFSNFEGGIRVNAFVAGGAVPASRRGSKEPGFIYISDWYATYTALAGIDADDPAAAAAGLPPPDSHNVWPLLSGANSTSPREEIVVGDTSALLPNGDGRTLVGGLIRGRYKLLVGAEDKLRTIDQYVQTGPSWPNRSSHLVPLTHWKLCGRTPRDGCLFDIFSDPTERTSLAEAQPTLFHDMLARIDELQGSVYSPVRGSKDSRACQAAKEKYGTANGPYWGPFD
mmetsp:Transcript_9953/g.29567  ORF Transcript_9953/g.29567 Transcript_9953/m.29567 type:complete len:437 (-) Transcript_9953:305-1615(-)